MGRRIAMFIKTVTIALLLGSISAVHFMYHGSDMGFHIFHQQLFFIPLILASFWFGLRTGIIVAVTISLLYGIPMVLRDHEASSHLIVITQIFLYFIIALLIGWLSDRERNQQQKLFQNERINALGKAASALSFEIQDIVRRIERIHQRATEQQVRPIHEEMGSEIDRLKRFLEALSKFSKPLADLTLSDDLNDLIHKRLPIYNQRAADKGVKIIVEPAEEGCPYMVMAASLPRVLDSLVDNAIDFSEKGQSIILRSKREGDFCIFEVTDSGPGVAKENEDKLFSAFFTTKPDGYGLSLSSGRKVLRDLGGDIVYRANETGGSVFSMKIPRESLDTKTADGTAYSEPTSPESESNIPLS